ncbi:RHO1 GDP-GTP exchange protein 2 [Rhodotorula kratochvilovae]
MPAPGSRQQQAFDEIFRRPAAPPQQPPQQQQRPPTSYRPHPLAPQQAPPAPLPQGQPYAHPHQQYYQGQYAQPLPVQQQPPPQPYAQFGMTTSAATASTPSSAGYGAKTPLARPQGGSYRAAGADPASAAHRASYFDQAAHAAGGAGAPSYSQGAASYSSQRSYSSAQAYQQGSWSSQASAAAPSAAVQGYFPAPGDGEYGKLPDGAYPASTPTARSYASPRSGYAASMSSGPPTASTSTSLFSRPSTSSASSLPYTYPDSGHSNGSTPASLSPNMSPIQSSHAPLPPSGASAPAVPGYGPPRLPEIGTHGDFFSFDAQESAEASWPRRQSGGGGGSATPTVSSAYGKRSSPAVRGESADEFDVSGSGVSLYDYNPSAAFDRSRRSSTDSDRRSLYQPQLPPHETRPYLPLNQSTASLVYPYGVGQPFSTGSPALQPRRSTESMRVMPTQPKMAQAYPADRALSFSSTERPDLYRGLDSAMLPASVSAFSSSQPSLPMTVRPPSYSSAHGAPPGPAAGALVPRRSPVVYPALLSRVAAAFRERIATSERIKDGLVYQDAFDGRDAVDRIAYIIKTSDRNLALLLGRALDAQKFFHDVTYAHRLRDSPNEIYQFKARLASPFLSSDDLVPGDQQQVAQHPHAPHSAAAAAQAAGQAARGSIASYDPRRGSTATTATAAGIAGALGLGQEEDDSPLPSGVFTLLTDCYSPTCTRDRLCYSIACPRRLEQQARLNLKREGLSGGLEDVGKIKRSPSLDSLVELREPGSLWIHSVPQEVIDATSDAEKKRQEAINEVFYTERDFVRDLEYLRDFWIKPLRSSNIIPEARREDFVTQVFWNVLEIYAVNVRLVDLLNKRQKQAHVVDHIGDIFLDMVPHFAPYVKYGAHQLYGKYEFEKEKGSNPAFAKFVDETERLPESRKLELNGYLTKPTTRLARYPLLLEATLKHTADDSPDKVAIPKVIKLVREFLAKVNVETGKSENRFNLAQLDQQLVFKNGEAVDLRLRDEERELIFKGPLKKRGGTQSESAELQVFLFDHAILMVKQKSKNEQYKVYRKPIPLELLVVAPVDDAATARGGVARPRSLMARGASSKILPATASQPPPGADKNKQGFAVTFIHLGRRGYQITLWASTWTARKKWLDKIEERQNELRERSLVFETLPLTAGYFVGTNRLTCAAPFDNGNRMVYGTDNGVYLADLREPAKVPVKVISVPSVTQVDVLEEQGILIVLADKAVQTFFVDHLDPGDAVGAAKRARKISANATFFKAGQCLGRTLVCVVKSGSVSSTIKTLEPIDQTRGKKQPTIRKFLQGSNESLRVFKEFYIPTESSSVHFLKSKLCVGCTKGFEIVDLETLDTQGLLDPADSSLDFVQKRENAKPIAIYRIDGEFLLCYDEFAFYVNKNGWRAKSNWIIQWEGFPTSFALHYPYVLAFEPTFIEVRHVESGALMQIIPGNNIKCLFADSPPSASAAAYYQSTTLAARYGSPYARPSPPPPPYGARNGIIVADGDRAFSLCFNAPVGDL